jgi:muramoyltetrapeptide carboxypeptidase
LHKAGINVAWGPMPQDALRGDHGLLNGTAAINRALDWLVRRDPAALEPALDGPAMAFNLTVLSNLLGTPLEPDFTGVDLIIEEVGEHLYRIDRSMFHVTAGPALRVVRRLRLGRVADILPNDPAFGTDEVAIVEQWCARSGILFGGRADIGHDSANRVVPFPSRKS